MSLINKLNKKGAICDPCGTQEVTEKVLERELANFTIIGRPRSLPILIVDWISFIQSQCSSFTLFTHTSKRMRSKISISLKYENNHIRFGMTLSRAKETGTIALDCYRLE
ncbi:hypothetical protein J6590_100395 [Homalodisca vitripennis]|nr:hypothetical protein J6590_100395 [Homalodisca vitripennis]